MNHAPISISKSVEETAVRYSIHRSKYKRFPDRPLMTEAPDVTYDVDGCTLSKNKASLAAAVAKSPMTYRLVGLVGCGGWVVGWLGEWVSGLHLRRGCLALGKRVGECCMACGVGEGREGGASDDAESALA